MIYVSVCLVFVYIWLWLLRHWTPASSDGGSTQEHRREAGKLLVFSHAAVAVTFSLVWLGGAMMGYSWTGLLDWASSISTAFFIVESWDKSHADNARMMLTIVGHHLFAVCFLSGLFVESEYLSTWIFLLSESSVFFYQFMVWLRDRNDGGMLEARRLCHWLSVLSFFAFRLLGYPIVTLFFVFPEMRMRTVWELWTRSLYALCLVVVYLLNCIWFVQLLAVQP